MVHCIFCCKKYPDLMHGCILFGCQKIGTGIFSRSQKQHCSPRATKSKVNLQKKNSEEISSLNQFVWSATILFEFYVLDYFGEGIFNSIIQLLLGLQFSTGGYCTEVALVLLTQLLQVRIPALLRFFLITA